MTHSVNGYILSQQRFGPRDILRVQEVVRCWMRGNGRYECRGDDLGERYSMLSISDERIQPFVNVFDALIRLREWNELFGCDERLVIGINSGSHVSIKDTEYAKQIYDATMILRRMLGRKMPNKRLNVVFDDEHRIYLPEDFAQALKEAA